MPLSCFARILLYCHSMKSRKNWIDLVVEEDRRGWPSSAMVTLGTGPIGTNTICSASGNWNVADGGSSEVRESAFYSNKVGALKGLWDALEERGIYPQHVGGSKESITSVSAPQDEPDRGGKPEKANSLKRPFEERRKSRGAIERLDLSGAFSECLPAHKRRLASGTLSGYVSALSATVSTCLSLRPFSFAAVVAFPPLPCPIPR